jgi:lipooligosaccharide transport system ATP-binding protein
VPEPLLRISHLTKKFGAATVVDDLSLEIMPGECLGVIGPNGAGKTTTIRICLGLAGADGGTIEAFGLPVPAQVREAKKRIGVVTQFDSLDPDFSCAENLRVYGAYFGLPRAVIDERVPKLLDFAALQSKANVKPGELSGGMKRRLSLGRALVNDPDLLLLDEPTTGLDPQARHLMWERLQNLLQQGKAILLTTHFMDEAERLCDRLIVLDHGRKIAEGTPRKLIAEHLESDVEGRHRPRRARRSRRDERRDGVLLRSRSEAAARCARRGPRHPLPASTGQPRGPVPEAHRPPDPRRRVAAPSRAPC